MNAKLIEALKLAYSTVAAAEDREGIDFWMIQDKEYVLKILKESLGEEKFNEFINSCR